MIQFNDVTLDAKSMVRYKTISDFSWCYLSDNKFRGPYNPRIMQSQIMFYSEDDKFNFAKSIACLQNLMYHKRANFSNLFKILPDVKEIQYDSELKRELAKFGATVSIVGTLNDELKSGEYIVFNDDIKATSIPKLVKTLDSYPHTPCYVFVDDFVITVIQFLFKGRKSVYSSFQRNNTTWRDLIRKIASTLRKKIPNKFIKCVHNIDRSPHVLNMADMISHKYYSIKKSTHVSLDRYVHNEDLYKRNNELKISVNHTSTSQLTKFDVKHVQPDIADSEQYAYNMKRFYTIFSIDKDLKTEYKETLFHLKYKINKNGVIIDDILYPETYLLRMLILLKNRAKLKTPIFFDDVNTAKITHDMVIKLLSSVPANAEVSAKINIHKLYKLVNNVTEEYSEEVLHVADKELMVTYLIGRIVSIFLSVGFHLKKKSGRSSIFDYKKTALEEYDLAFNIASTRIMVHMILDRKRLEEMNRGKVFFPEAVGLPAAQPSVPDRDIKHAEVEAEALDVDDAFMDTAADDEIKFNLEGEEKKDMRRLFDKDQLTDEDVSLISENIGKADIKYHAAISKSVQFNDDLEAVESEGETDDGVEDIKNKKVLITKLVKGVMASSVEITLRQYVKFMHNRGMNQLRPTAELVSNAGELAELLSEEGKAVIDEKKSTSDEKKTPPHQLPVDEKKASSDEKKDPPHQPPTSSISGIESKQILSSPSTLPDDIKQESKESKEILSSSSTTSDDIKQEIKRDDSIAVHPPHETLLRELEIVSDRLDNLNSKHLKYYVQTIKKIGKSEAKAKQNSISIKNDIDNVYKLLVKQIDSLRKVIATSNVDAYTLMFNKIDTMAKAQQIIKNDNKKNFVTVSDDLVIIGSRIDQIVEEMQKFSDQNNMARSNPFADPVIDPDDAVPLHVVDATIDDLSFY